MNYTDFYKMIPEATLVAILVVLFIADFVSAKAEERKWFNPLACVLLLLNTVVCLLPLGAQSAFGGMYETSTAINVMKAILSMGTFIVFLQSQQWALYDHRFYTPRYVCHDECRQLLNVLPRT